MSAKYRINFNKEGEGFIVNEVAGENLGIHKLVYRNAAGTWSLADADTVATMPVLGITLGAITTGKKGEILLWGYIGDILTWAWTPGGEIYASTVAGELTQTMPTGIGDVVQVVAVAVEDDIIQFTGNVGGSHGKPWDRVTEASYIVFTDGTTTYAKNGVTGQIDYSNTDPAVVIQAAIDALSSPTVIFGGEVFIKRGIYAYTDSLVMETYHGVRLSGEGYGTILQYTGTDFALILNDSDQDERFDTIDNLRINLSGANPLGGIQITGSSHYHTLNNVYIRGASVSATCVGIEIDGTSGSYWNQYANIKMWDLGYGVHILNAGNANFFTNLLIRTPLENGKGVWIESGSTNCFVNAHVEGPNDNIIAFDIDSDNNSLINPSIELDGGGTTAFDFAGDLNRVYAPIIQAATLNYVFTGTATGNLINGRQPKTVFCRVMDADTNIGNHPAVLLGDGVDTTVYDQFSVPVDFLQLIGAEVIIVAGATGDFRRSAASSWGLIDSETYLANNDSLAADEVAVTINRVTGIDITDLFTNIDRNDQVGFTFVREGSDVNDTVNADCYYLGVRIRYV